MNRSKTVLKKYSPRSEREAILILDIKDEDLLDIALDEIRKLNPPDADDDEGDDFLETMSFPHDHYSNLVEGWDSNFVTFNKIADNCELCKLYDMLWRYRIQKEHGMNVEFRLQCERNYANVQDLTRKLVSEKAPNDIGEIAYLLGDNDFFDDDDDGSFGGGLFGYED